VQDNYIVLLPAILFCQPFRKWIIHVYSKVYFIKSIPTFALAEGISFVLKPDKLSINNFHDVGINGREAQS
jgi:hypothetical protein